MIAVIFGGRSCEHDVSIVTGLMTLHSLKKAVPVYIDREGKFWCGKGLEDIEFYKKFSPRSLRRVHFMPADNGLYTDKGKKLHTLEAAVVCCHGAYGEDGCLQGLLEISGVPYTCGGVLAGAAGMDKIAMKQLFSAANLPCVNYIGVKRSDFENEKYDFVAELKSDFSLPLIVKPANLGSSIGIGLAHDYEELFDRMRVAFEFDNTVIIEQALEDFVEINCAALGDRDGVEVSLTEQPTGWKEFLSYEDKYLSKGKEGARRKMPAPIDEVSLRRIEELTVKAFDAVNATGVARVDFLMHDGQIYVNEINTVPGSLAYYLFDGKYTLETLTERLIELAKKRRAEKDALVYTYGGGKPRHMKK